MNGKTFQETMRSARESIERSKRHLREGKRFLGEMAEGRSERKALREKQITEVDQIQAQKAQLQAEHEELTKKLTQARTAILDRIIERNQPQRNGKAAPRPKAARPVLQKLPNKQQDLSRYFDNGHLTERQRQVASLRLEYGLSVNQISKRLGISRPAVDKNLHGANKKLEKSESLYKSLKRQAARQSSDD